MIKLVILGTGNVASHLFDAFFKTKGVVVVQVYNHKAASLKPFAEKTQTTSALNELVEADIYLISVKDDAVEELASKIPYKNKLIAHTSGSVPLLSVGQKNAVFYPLQTFSKEVALDFSKIPLCIEASDSESFSYTEALAKQVSNKVFSIDTKQRKSLHLAAVFACNFANYMYHVGETICHEKNIPFEILHPLMAETTRKAIANSPKEVQTGPAKRNDKKTMGFHLTQLKTPFLRKLYRLISEGILKNQ